MTHLGSRISALVDGQLSVVETERALAHVAGCPRCAGELTAARRARDVLASAADPGEPAPDLTARLLSLAPGPVQRPVRRDPFAGPRTEDLASAFTLRPAAGVLGLRGQSHALRGEVTGGGRSPSRLVVGAVAGLGLAAVGLFALGARPAVVPTDHPAVALGLLGQASAPSTSTAGTVRAASTVGGVDDLTTGGWTAPRLPAGWTVAAVRAGSAGSSVELDLLAPTGSAVVVTEQQGRLDTAALEGVTVRHVGGRSVYVLSTSPRHLVWQSDASVVQVVTTLRDDELTDLVAAFPATPFDDGVPARIGRGWSTVAHVLARS